MDYRIIIAIAVGCTVLGVIVYSAYWSPEAKQRRLQKKYDEAKTAEDFRYVWWRAPANSPLELQARSRFVSLVRERLQKATTFEETLALLDLLWIDDPHVEPLYEEAFQKAFDLLTSVEEIELLLEMAEEDSVEEHDLFVRWIGMLQTVEECIYMVDEYGYDTVVGEMAILRAAEILAPEYQLDVSGAD